MTKRIPTADALFNLIEDPKETRNVIEENPELAEKARTLIAQKRKQWQELIQRFNPEERSNPIELSDEEIEQLKSVGYLQ